MTIDSPDIPALEEINEEAIRKIEKHKIIMSKKRSIMHFWHSWFWITSPESCVR